MAYLAAEGTKKVTVADASIGSENRLSDLKNKKWHNDETKEKKTSE